MTIDTAALDVPGARLYYERRGSGPQLLMIGSPMDSTGFAGLASALADDYTVVTYDPRGIGNSSREDNSQDVTPGQQADDVHRLLSVLGGEPAYVFGSSGAVVGLALVTAHPGQVRTLVAHEPPVVELLADRAQQRAQFQDVYDTYRADGAEADSWPCPSSLAVSWAKCSPKRPDPEAAVPSPIARCGLSPGRRPSQLPDHPAGAGKSRHACRAGPARTGPCPRGCGMGLRGVARRPWRGSAGTLRPLIPGYRQLRCLWWRGPGRRASWRRRARRPASTARRRSAPGP